MNEPEVTDIFNSLSVNEQVFMMLCKVGATEQALKLLGEDPSIRTDVINGEALLALYRRFDALSMELSRECDTRALTEPQLKR